MAVKAILAANEVTAKVTVTRVIQLHAVPASIALRAVDAFITHFTLHDKTTVRAALAVLTNVGVQHVFCFITAAVHVAIFYAET